MARIAVATFQHETNTFAPSRASFADFEAGGGWPGYCTGARVLEAVSGTNIPIEGFVRAIGKAGHVPVPLVFANATPSAHVEDDAFERVAAAMLEALAAAGDVDALYLDLHGAMVTQSHEDGEGEILRRVRAAVGARVPVVASLDLHANASAAMLEASDGMVAYRTYPHVDMAETGARAADLLLRMLARGERPAKAMRSLGFLMPLTSQCTLVDPCASVYAELARAEARAGAWLSFATGFPAADVACCGPSVFGMGFDGAALARELDALEAMLLGRELEFRTEFRGSAEAVRRAIAIAAHARRPVLLADTQDNPGAGGNGDTTGLLAELLAQRVPSAMLGLLVDAPSARRAHEAGIGAELEFSLGALSGLPGHVPVTGRFRVEALGDGGFTCTGPFYQGARMALGPMAALRQGGVVVALASRKVQAADQEMFRHLGLDPARAGIVALKSSVHFRAHFQPIAEEVLVVAAPGPMAADPAALSWRRLRRGIRLGPGGRAF
ncbi:MAG: M81 family metallopeptidase [Alphaproteobacteria bacterium]